MIHCTLNDPDRFARLLLRRPEAIHVLEAANTEWRIRTGSPTDAGPLDLAPPPHIHIHATDSHMEVHLDSGHPQHDDHEACMAEEWWPSQQHRAGCVHLKTRRDQEGGQR